MRHNEEYKKIRVTFLPRYLETQFDKEGQKNCQMTEASIGMKKIYK